MIYSAAKAYAEIGILIMATSDRKLAQQILSVLRNSEDALSTRQIVNRLKVRFRRTNVTMAEVHSALEEGVSPSTYLNEAFKWQIDHERSNPNGGQAMIHFNCPGCGVSFTKPESAAGQYVQCAACGTRFHVPKSVAQPETLVAQGGPRKDLDSPSVNELVDARALVQEFWNDCTELQKLGITVSKVGMSAKVGGVGGGIGAGIATGDPIIGIALAIGGWLVDSIAKDYAMTRLEQTRMKWHNIFSCLTERQANLFASEMQNRYPHLIPAVRQMLPGA